MRLFVAAAIAISVLYFWDKDYNNGKFADGVTRLVGSIARTNRWRHAPAPDRSSRRVLPALGLERRFSRMPRVMAAGCCYPSHMSLWSEAASWSV